MLFKFRWTPDGPQPSQRIGGTECFPRTVLPRKPNHFILLFLLRSCATSPLLWTLLFLWTLDQSVRAPTLGIFYLRKNFKVISIRHSNLAKVLNFAVRFPDTFGGGSSQLGLERIVLSANGNLQRVMSAYYNRYALLARPSNSWYPDLLFCSKKESEYWGVAQREAAS